MYASQYLISFSAFTSKKVVLKQADRPDSKNTNARIWEYAAFDENGDWNELVLFGKPINDHLRRNFIVQNPFEDLLIYFHRIRAFHAGHGAGRASSTHYTCSDLAAVTIQIQHVA